MPDIKTGTPKTRQYYYRDNKCTAAGAEMPDCICWHDEGTGPYGDDFSKAQSWRVKPVPQCDVQTASVWQPIETAPKDGTPVLLGFPGHFHAMHGHYEYGFWGQLDSDFGFEHLPTQPTHWMSLPVSPVPSADRGGK